jgi:hypothetical protein
MKIDKHDDHPRNCECRRCNPEEEPDYRLPDRDEWKHEVAQWQRLK